MNIYWVYMLLCADQSFYVGVTNDLECRIGRHDFGIDRRCYTFRRRPLILVYSSEFHHVEEAIAWEKQLKGWSRAKKQALIGKDWPRISELARNYWGRQYRSVSPEEAALSPFDRLRVTKQIAQGDKADRSS